MLVRARDWATALHDAQAGPGGGEAGSRDLKGAVAGVSSVVLSASGAAADPGSQGLAVLEKHGVQPAARLAAALLQHWRQPERQQEDALALALAAAARSCAHLRCANIAQEGGPAAGEGERSAKCSACRAVWCVFSFRRGGFGQFSPAD